MFFNPVLVLRPAFGQEIFIFQSHSFENIALRKNIKTEAFGWGDGGSGLWP
jgi:hypothetical protein